MELEGNLRTFQLPDILRFLAMGHMTGTLTLAGGERTVELLIKEGRLVGTSAPERSIRLGQLLVYSGLLSRKDLNEALEQQTHDSERMLGEMLIERKLATSQQVEQALLLQIKEELWELFSWSDGTFNFEHGGAPGMKRALLELDIEPLLAEGLERLEQWRALVRNMGNGDDVYQVRSDLNSMPEARLTPNEWRVLALVNGHTNVRALVALAGLGRFETFCALDRLQQAQLIELAARARRNSGHKATRHHGEIQLVPAPGIESQHGEDHEDGEDNGEQGFFARLTRRKRNEPLAQPRDGAPARPLDAQVGPFFTAVGWACALLNRVADCLHTETGQGIDLGDLWRDESGRFPKADLLAMRQGKLEANLFERYVQLADGIDAALAGTNDDCLSALGEVGAALMSQARKVLGARAESWLNDVLRPYLDHVEIRHPAEFAPRAWSERLRKSAD
jgi:hypothetical protein